MIIPSIARDVLLEDAAARDRGTARRLALLEILFRDRYLTRAQLIVRVEGKLGKGCFGDSAWEDLFFRDMQVVKRAFEAAGYQPAYSRSTHKPGYYLRNQPSMSPDLLAALDGSIAETDPVQIAAFKMLSFRQRFQQGCSITDLANRVAAHRTRQRDPSLNLVEAHRRAVKQKAYP